MYINFLAAATEPTVEFSLQWLPWIVLISAFVAIFIAVLIKMIYVVLQLFPKSEPPKK